MTRFFVICAYLKVRMPIHQKNPSSYLFNSFQKCELFNFLLLKIVNQEAQKCKVIEKNSKCKIAHKKPLIVITKKITESHSNATRDKTCEMIHEKLVIFK